MIKMRAKRTVRETKMTKNEDFFWQLRSLDQVIQQGKTNLSSKMKFEQIGFHEMVWKVFIKCTCRDSNSK